MIASPVVGSALSSRLVRAHAARAVLVWLAAHFILALAAGEISSLALRGTVITAAVAFAVSYVDGKRRREAGFLENLGVPATFAPALAGATVVALEAMLTAVTSVVR